TGLGPAMQNWWNGTGSSPHGPSRIPQHQPNGPGNDQTREVYNGGQNYYRNQNMPPYGTPGFANSNVSDSPMAPYYNEPFSPHTYYGGGGGFDVRLNFGGGGHGHHHGWR